MWNDANTHFKKFVSHTTTNQPIVQRRVEHLVFACKRQLVRMTPYGLGVIHLSGALLSRNTALLEDRQRVKDKLIAMFPALPKLGSGIVRRGSCNPILLSLEVGIEDLCTV